MSSRRKRLAQRVMHVWSKLSTLSRRAVDWSLEKYHTSPRVRARYFEHTSFKTPREAHAKMMPEKKMEVLEIIDKIIKRNTFHIRDAMNDHSPGFLPQTNIDSVIALSEKFFQGLKAWDIPSFVHKYSEEVWGIVNRKTSFYAMNPKLSRLTRRMLVPTDAADAAAQRFAAEIALHQVGVGIYTPGDVDLTNRVMDIMDSPQMNSFIRAHSAQSVLSFRERRMIFRKIVSFLGPVRTLLFIRYFSQNYSELHELY